MTDTQTDQPSDQSDPRPPFTAREQTPAKRGPGRPPGSGAQSRRTEPIDNPLSIVESQERANIDMLIATAKHYPRDIATVKRKMEALATLDEETAESCNYCLIRQGKTIEGPTVRMAEIAVACYQNIRAGARVIGSNGRTITGQAFCHDLENNVFIAIETERRITDSQGRLYSDDMQVLTGNAACAIAFRNVVFKVIPGALIKPVADKAKAIVVGDLKTLTQRRTRALKSLATIGVTQEMVLALLERRSVEEIDIEDVGKLFGVFTAIKDGTSTVEEQFPKKIIEKPVFSKPKQDLSFLTPPADQTDGAPQTDPTDDIP